MDLGTLLDLIVLGSERLKDLLVDAAAEHRISDVNCRRIETEVLDDGRSHLLLKLVRLSPIIFDNQSRIQMTRSLSSSHFQ